MDTDLAYQQTLDYLYKFVDFSLQKQFPAHPEKFDLGRMRVFLERLGNPHQRYPIIHIAGTKGKGSVSVLCASALSAAGYRVGLFTSPHLLDYTERIQMNLMPISQAALVQIVNENRQHIEAVPEITTFEITTGLAFLYFAQQQATAAVIEVGLGGRLDATNVVSPSVSVITSLSYDHMSLLGNTLTQIATEKAGIIKPGRPVVVSPQQDEARETVTRIAAERGSPLIQVGEDYLYKSLSHSLEGQSLLVWNKDSLSQERLEITLLGSHQVENAATAYAALKTGALNGLPIQDDQIQAGFAQAHWPGRFEVLRRVPPLVVDSAHNRDSAQRLRQAVDEYFPGMPALLVFGASEDKDIQGILEELLPRMESVITTASIHPRAAEPGQLASQVQALGRPAKATATIEEALETALQDAGADHLILVAGSIFIAAGAKQAWEKRAYS